MLCTLSFPLVVTILVLPLLVVSAHDYPAAATYDDAAAAPPVDAAAAAPSSVATIFSYSGC
jgi:hypothetical protein